MPLPPLNRLRKSVVFFAFLFFFFILYRLLLFKTNEVSPVSKENAVNIYTEMCLLVTSGGPVNVDTVFNLKSGVNKIFAYSFLAEDFNSSDTIRHIWHYGYKVVKDVACKMGETSCFSSISTDTLQEGNWSVDTRQGNTLLNVRQFRIDKF
jgi:hypothetical protein